MGKLLTQKYIGSYRSPNDNHSFPHDARPHHAGAGKALYEEKYDAHICQETKAQMMVAAILRKPLEMTISEEFENSHSKDYQKRRHKLVLIHR